MRGEVLFFLLGSVLAGCHGNQKVQSLILSDDETIARNELLKHIPVHSSIDDAEMFMRRNHFDCSREHDEAGLYLYCDRSGSKDAFVETRWQVLIRYETDTVTDIKVSVGYIGP